MPIPGSCYRCSRPLAVDSDSGMCQTCLASANTVDVATGVSVPAEKEPVVIAAAPPADPADPSATATADAHSEARTLSFNPSIGTTKPCELPDAPPGYELLRQLGSGGMGDVYLARDLATERLVAMKFMHESRNPLAADRFLTEIRALARINHSSIVRIFATDVHRAVPYFTMEYISGGTLGARVSTEGPLPDAVAARLLATVARAVHAAHSAGVLHRDMKPSNVLLSTAGDPVVADFGLAKRTDFEENLTFGSGPLGTPGFMPPEQVSKKNGKAGPGADIYGVGATLYYVVTGRPPFSGETPHDVATRVVGEPPEPPRLVRSAVSAGLEAIILKCLEKDPAHRYASAEELAADLDRFAAGQAPTAPIRTRWRRMRQWGVRRRAHLALAMAMIALGAGLIAAWPRTTAVTPPDPAEVMCTELRAGRSVNLIGETGTPAYHRWRVGGTAFGESITGDKTCYYQSIGLTLLELVPDPGIDAYRLELEVRQLEAAGGPGNADRSYLGPYFGHAERNLTDGRPVHSFFPMTFADIHTNAGPAKNPVNIVRARDVIMVLNPGTDPGITQSQLRSLSFPAENRPMGDWRTFRIDVRPEGVSVGWKDGEGFKLVYEAGPAELQKANQSLQDQFNRTHPNGLVIVPDWNPRMPLGVFAYRASLSLKNVTISPLRSSP